MQIDLRPHERRVTHAPRALGALFLSLSALAVASGCATGTSGGQGGAGGQAATTASGSGGGSSTGASTGASTGQGGETSASTSAGTGGGGGGGLLDKFPDTSATIAVLADQLPGGMTKAQVAFAATHFAGTQKLTLDLAAPLRAENPAFIVLHYHLAMWQSAPGVPFILDGKSWGNDYGFVSQHETWFWHNTAGKRVASVVDGKLLMNVADPGFQAYWIDSLAQQVAAGQYDGVFFDSASPALLQAEAQSPPEPRLAGTGARDNPIPELGNKTFIQAWQEWIALLDVALAGKGIPLIANTGPFVTSWDSTDYSLTEGVFSEGYADPTFSAGDWEASTNHLLALAAKGKIMILQNYLGTPGDVARRLYYLGNYLLVKADRTYIDYFASGPLEWYPEWGLDLGKAQKTGATAADLSADGVYRRDFEKGVVLVNPSSSPVTVTLGATLQRVDVTGGGAIDEMGSTPGSVAMTPVTSVDVAAKGAVILLR